MRDRGCPLLRSPILERDDRIVIPGTEKWFNVDWFMMHLDSFKDDLYHSNKDLNMNSHKLKNHRKLCCIE